MAIIRRQTHNHPRFDVEWRLPDRSKRRNAFKTEREARIFEAAIVTKTAAGDVVDPRAGRITLAKVYEAWLASRLDLSPRYGGDMRISGVYGCNRASADGRSTTF